ncbi:hypothetical protein SAMN04488168_1469 [Bacillus sp. 491mf]|uniref:hypothetical protein n=1 Tax=Bacillus sp. 491mf TaxID=1761755 RepID=UPI0008E01C17|nr:hypothetical protein [Bacillus sp. 491mf]SFD50335.1 hypothetical protein SAMN04488168_1469 [Bacillus sp. 491mf]
MNVLNMEQVNVKVIIDNGNGSMVECFEKGVKISDTLILSIYEAGICINELYYDQTGDIVLGDEVLDLLGAVNDAVINLEEISSMNAIEFLLKIATIKRELH